MQDLNGLRVRVARHAGSEIGLGPDAFRAWAAERPTKEAEALWRKYAPMHSAAVAALEQARRDDLIAEEAGFKARLDRGELPRGGSFDRSTKLGPRLQKLNNEWAVRAPEFGLRSGDVREGTSGQAVEPSGFDVIRLALAPRVTILKELLAERRKTEGEPAGAKALREKIDAATTERWRAHRLWLEAQRAYREGGGILGNASEGDPVAAAAAESAAAAKLRELQAELYTKFGIEK